MLSMPSPSRYSVGREVRWCGRTAVPRRSLVGTLPEIVSKLWPCLPGHRIALWEVEQRDIELRHQEVLKVGDQHVITIDEDLGSSARLAPPTLDVHTFGANEQLSSGGAVFITKTTLRVIKGRSPRV